MITPTDIRQKAARLYLPFLRSWLIDQPFFPQGFLVGKLPSDYVELRKGVHVLQAQSKARRGRGYTLEYKVHQKRFSGQQTLPIHAIIETERDFLWLVEKEEEFGLFCAFLCGAKAGFITGQNILLDGGAYPGTL